MAYRVVCRVCDYSETFEEDVTTEEGVELPAKFRAREALVGHRKTTGNDVLGTPGHEVDLVEVAEAA